MIIGVDIGSAALGAAVMGVMWWRSLGPITERHKHLISTMEKVADADRKRAEAFAHVANVSATELFACADELARAGAPKVAASLRRTGENFQRFVTELINKEKSVGHENRHQKRS